MNIDTAIKNGFLDLKKKNIKSALLDSEILMSKVLNQDRSKIILNYGDLLISFPPNTLDKEDSVKIVSDFKYAIKKNQYT